MASRGPLIRVLIVEDDRVASETLRMFLVAHGFAATTVFDGTSAIALARDVEPAVVLLDVMLPGLDGFEVCRRLRQFTEAAILILTAKTFESDRLAGLRGGADDYIVKPYSLHEVLARIHAVLRRTKPSSRRFQRVVNVGNATIDLRSQSVTIDGQACVLTPTHFRLLACLAQSVGTPISRGELIERVLGADYEGLDRTIDVHVAGLRKRLAAHANCGIAIATAFGFGYALEEN
jgi:DNA-binding response OmpR family regulator